MLVYTVDTVLVCYNVIYLWTYYKFIDSNVIEPFFTWKTECICFLPNIIIKLQLEKEAFGYLCIKEKPF